MIIGITGPAGAGKSTLAQYLVDNFNFKHISVREYLSYRLNEKKLPITRDNLVKIANQLRKDNGSDYIISELYEEALKYPNSVIESIRTPGEVITLKKQKDFKLIAIDADIEIRYKRIKKRKESVDNITFEEFKTEEQKELHSNDPWKQNITQCMKMADIKLYINGSLNELFEKVNQSLTL